MIQMLKVTKGLASLHMQQFLLHREFWFKFFVSSILPTLMPMLVWGALYDNQLTDVISGWSKEKMQNYYFLVLIITSLSQVEIHYFMSSLILDGSLNQWLMRPIKGSELLISFSMARLIGLTMPATVVTFFLAKGIFNLHLGTISYYGIMLLPFSIIICAMVSILVGIISFWTVKTEGIFAGIFIVLSFFGGAIVPLSLLPTSLGTMANFLPFKYALHIPITMALNNGEMNDFIIALLHQFIWILVLGTAILYLWSIGLKKYDAIGG